MDFVFHFLTKLHGVIKINKYLYFIIAALLGVLFPTSINGQISTALTLGSSLGVIFFLLISINLNRWQWNRIGYLLALFVIILFFTMISPFPYIAWGGLVPYILASIVLLTDFRWFRNIEYIWIDELLIYVISLINLFILIIGFGVVMSNSFAIEFLEKYYQSISNDLFEQMVVWYSKPVTIFGSHSTAAFAYFSLFTLNIKLTFNINLNKIWRLFFLASAIGFLILNLFLLSNASVVMTIFMGIVLFIFMNKSMPSGVRVIFIGLLIVGVVVLIADLNIFQLLIGNSRDNGLLARYTSGGRLQGTYNYLFENYFTPIGISYDPRLSLGDNFIAEYIIKTSVVGYGIILYLLWTWLHRHLYHYSAMIFFGFFILADLAYPLLVYSRVASALPFFVLLWGRLESNYFLKSNRKTNRFIYDSSLIVKL